MVVLILCYFIRIMDPTSSLGRIFLGENVYGSSSEKVEGHGDWNALEYTNTTGSKEGNKEDDVEPGVIFGRSFMSLVNGIVDFGSGVITVYPEQDPFEDDSEKTEKCMDDWDQLLDFNFDDIPQLGREELLSFVCKIGESSRNKKRAIENLNLFYPDIRPSSSTRRHLTQDEAVKEALELRISQKFSLLEEVRQVLETMAYHNNYKKVLDKIWKDKVELDGMIVKKEEEAINKVK
ncbi:hypothetical protein Tco_1481346, partial [Tanacetum coccineum]